MAAPAPIYRGQGNQPFRSDAARDVLKRGQSVPVTATDVGAGTGGGYSVTAKNATYSETATSGDLVILCSGTFTINLPTAAGNSARITAKLITAGAVTLDPAGAETIDGAGTAVVNVQYASLTLVSNGVNWSIV